MSLVQILSETAEAIRNKKGTTDKIKPANFASEIESISSGGENTLKKLFDYTKSTKTLCADNIDITDVTNYFSFEDTSNVIDVTSMFHGCINLIAVPQLDTSNVKNASRMFAACSSLLDIPQLDIRNSENNTSMFGSCRKLKKISILTSSINYTEFSSMFSGCYEVEKIDLSGYKTSWADNSRYMFSECYSLKTLIIREFGASFSINSNAFDNCYHLKGTVNNTYNPEGLKDCYIYVPNSMVSKLKSATNWSTYADQIRALEDYTVDGTTAGELDESKVNA